MLKGISVLNQYQFLIGMARDNETVLVVEDQAIYDTRISPNAKLAVKALASAKRKILAMGVKS